MKQGVGNGWVQLLSRVRKGERSQSGNGGSNTTKTTSGSYNEMPTEGWNGGYPWSASKGKPKGTNSGKSNTKLKKMCLGNELLNEKEREQESAQDFCKVLGG